MSDAKRLWCAASVLLLAGASVSGQIQAPPADVAALLAEVKALRSDISEMRSIPTTASAPENLRQWVAALAPILGSAVLIGGLLISSRNYRIAQEKHEGDWYATFRSLYEQFWTDAGMARVRKWIANDESYEKELKPILERRAQGPSAVDSAGYDLLEVIDRFGSHLALFVQLHPEGLPVQKREILARTFQYWTER